MKTTILSTIFRDLCFSKQEINSIGSKFEKLSLKKGTILLHANEIVNYQYFVQNGCLRTFFVDRTGKEHTIQFAINDWWISDYMAFFSESKALTSIEIIQDATLFKISKRDMELLYLQIPQLETFFRKKMEKAFARFQKRILGNLSQSAKERYISFRTQYPNIDQSVKNYHIASYLGITTESLSRIRKEIAQS